MKQSIGLKTLLLVGGGHAHVHVIKMLGMNPIPGVTVVLVTRDIDTPYSGMLPGYVAGMYTRDECHIDLCRLCSFARVHLIHGEAVGVDVVTKRVYLSDGRPPLGYDILSINIGIAPRTLLKGSGNGGATNITPVKPIDGFAKRWDVILARVLRNDSEESVAAPIRIVVVGGGGGGV